MPRKPFEKKLSSLKPGEYPKNKINIYVRISPLLSEDL